MLTDYRSYGVIDCGGCGSGGELVWLLLLLRTLIAS